MSIIIRLQNLPWAASSIDIRKYFQGLSIPEGGVHIVGGEKGDAFIAFSTDEDARQAMEKDSGKIKETRVKLMLSSRTEMQKVIEQARTQNIALQPSVSAQPVTSAPPKTVTKEAERRKQPERSRSPERRRERERSPADRDRRRSSRRERSRSRSPRRRSRDRERDRHGDRSKRDERKRSDEVSRPARDEDVRPLQSSEQLGVPRDQDIDKRQVVPNGEMATQLPDMRAISSMYPVNESVVTSTPTSYAQTVADRSQTGERTPPSSREFEAGKQADSRWGPPLPSDRGTPFPTSDRGTTFAASDRGALLPSSDRVTAFPPADRGAAFPPVDRGTTFPPGDRAAFPPADRGAAFPPVDRGAAFPPADRGATFPPAERGATFPPIDRSATFPPAERGAAFPPPDRGAAFPPADRGAAFPPADRSASFPPADRVTAFLPTDRTSFPPPDRGSVFPLSDRGISFPPPDRGVPFPPPDRAQTFPASDRAQTFPASDRAQAFSASDRPQTFPPSDRAQAFPTSDRAQTFPPPERGHTFPPPERGHAFPPPERGQAFPPPDRGQAFPPPDRGQTFPPDRGQSFPPPDRGQAFPPPDRGQAFPPPDRGQTFPPPDRGQTFPPPDRGQSFPPPDRGQSFPPPDRGQSFPPPDRGLSFPPPDRGQAFPPPDRGALFPSAERGNSFPPSNRSSSFAPSDRATLYPKSDRAAPFPSSDRVSSFPPPDRGGSFPQSERGGAFPPSERVSSFPQQNRGTSFPSSDAKRELWDENRRGLLAPPSSFGQQDKQYPTTERNYSNEPTQRARYSETQESADSKYKGYTRQPAFEGSVEDRSRPEAPDPLLPRPPLGRHEDYGDAYRSRMDESASSRYDDHRMANTLMDKRSLLNRSREASHSSPLLKTSHDSIHPSRRLPFSTCVEVRGMLYNASYSDVREHFRGIYIPPDGLKLTNDESGERKVTAFIRFSNEHDATEALKRGNRYMGSHYIEVFNCPEESFEKAVDSHMQPPKPAVASSLLNRMPPKEEDLCVMLKGLPYQCKEEDIINFFDGLGILDVFIEYDTNGRATGTGFVEFGTYVDFCSAMSMNRQTIGHRYIELAVASKDIMNEARKSFGYGNTGPNVEPPKPSTGPPKDLLPLPTTQLHDAQIPTCVLLQNLPYDVTDRDIADFFAGVGVVPRAIHIMLGPNGMPYGDSFAEFSNKQEFDRAIKKNGQFMGSATVTLKPIPYDEMMDILGGPLPKSEPLLDRPLTETSDKRIDLSDQKMDMQPGRRVGPSVPDRRMGPLDRRTERPPVAERRMDHSSLPDRRMDHGPPPDRRMNHGPPPDRRMDHTSITDRRMDHTLPLDRRMDHVPPLDRRMDSSLPSDRRIDHASSQRRVDHAPPDRRADHAPPDRRTDHAPPDRRADHAPPDRRADHTPSSDRRNDHISSTNRRSDHSTSSDRRVDAPGDRRSSQSVPERRGSVPDRRSGTATSDRKGTPPDKRTGSPHQQERATPASEKKMEQFDGKHDSSTAKEKTDKKPAPEKEKTEKADAKSDDKTKHATEATKSTDSEKKTDNKTADKVCDPPPEKKRHLMEPPVRWPPDEREKSVPPSNDDRKTITTSAPDIRPPSRVATSTSRSRLPLDAVEHRGLIPRPPMGARPLLSDRMRVPFNIGPGPEGFGRPGCVVAVNNIPYSAGVDDIINFFFGFMLSKEDIIRRFNDRGQPTGEARICFKSPQDAQRAVKDRNKHQLAGRTIHLYLL